MIKKGQTVHYVTDGGSIRTGTTEGDEAWGQCTVSFPGHSSESVPTMRLFNSSRAAHIASLNRKVMLKESK